MKLKTIALSLGLATMMLPASAMAQKTTVRPGGLFGLNDQPETSLLHRNIFEKKGLDLNVGNPTFPRTRSFG